MSVGRKTDRIVRPTNELLGYAAWREAGFLAAGKARPIEMASAFGSAVREPRICATGRPWSSILNHMLPRPMPLVP